MRTLKSYRYIYKILIDYMSRIVANFLFQFFIHRYIEITSILIAAVANSLSAPNSNIIIGVVALTHLFPSLMMNEGYIKIVPYIRAIYLNNHIVALYLLLNTIVPFGIYLMLFMVTLPEPPIIQNVVFMFLLLFNNTLFSHFLHIFSFSIKDTILYLPLIVTLYLVVFIHIDFLIVLLLTVTAVVLFISKIRSY